MSYLFGSAAFGIGRPAVSNWISRATAVPGVVVGPGDGAWPVAKSAGAGRPCSSRDLLRRKAGIAACAVAAAPVKSVECAFVNLTLAGH